MSTQLESVIDAKVKPLVESAIQKYLGVRVANIEMDISDQLKRSTLLDVPINTKIPFKTAKKSFKRAYMMRLLQQHLGNISTAADAAGVDRRSIHRLVLSLRVPTTKFREDAQPSYVRQSAVQGIIEGVLEQYRPALNPVKYKALSAQATTLSGDIVKELPEQHLTMAEAEDAFEKAYFTQLMKDCSTIARASRIAGIRYEVLHRKLKALAIKPKKA